MELKISILLCFPLYISHSQEGESSSCDKCAKKLKRDGVQKRLDFRYGDGDGHWGRRGTTETEFLSANVPECGVDSEAGGEGEDKSDLCHSPCNVEALLP